MAQRYERPQVWDLGKLAELTRMPTPAGLLVPWIR